MHFSADGSILLDLLREAGEEAVTFDELELVGIADPALALWDLELAGVHVQRVFDQRKLCVRLAEERAERAATVEQPTVEIEALAPPPPPPVCDAAAPSVTVTPVAARAASAGLLALLALVLFARRR